MGENRDDALAQEGPEALSDDDLLEATAEGVEPELEEVDAVAAPPPTKQRVQVSVEDITGEDQEFVRRVFNQVKDVDWRTAPPPPPRKNLAGLDKKLDFLRERVRELERDLARVGYVWSIKQRRVDLVEQIIQTKEAERQSAVERYGQVKDQGARSAAAWRAEEARLTQAINEQAAQKAALEATLAAQKQQHERMMEEAGDQLEREQDEKAHLVSDFRQKIETAQAAFAQLRDTSSRTIAELETKVRGRDEELERSKADLAKTRAELDSLGQTLATREAVLETTTQDLERARREHISEAAKHEEQSSELKRELGELRVALAERERDLAAARDEAAAQKTTLEGKVAQAEATLAQQKASNAGLVERLSEREKTLSTLADEMQRSRAERDERLGELRDALRKRETELERIQSEVASARNEFSQLAQDYERRKAELDELRKVHEATLADKQSLTAAAEENARRLTDKDAAVDAKEAQLQALTAELATAREELRMAKADGELLHKRVAELESR